MKKIFAPLLAALLISGAAFAQPITLPQVQSIGSADLFQDVVGGQPAAGNQYAASALLGGYGATLPGGNYDNALIGGDFSTNLFSRGTSVLTASATYYTIYGADRWFTWGGTSTPTTMTQQTGAGDFPAGAAASYRINKGSLTGTAQICTSQIVESASAYRFQGQNAEFTFDAKAGPTFSAASSNLAVYVSYGTANDGTTILQSSTYMAYGINAAGGAGTTAWTGQVNLGGTTGFLIPISTAWARYGVEVPIPTTALEIGVSICYTPVGTGTSTDWFEFGKAQLTINPALTVVAGTAGAILNVNDARAKSFARRPQGLETLLQQRYHVQYADSLAATFTLPGTCTEITSGATAHCMMVLPVPMRLTPTVTVATATSFGMTKVADGTAEACTTLAAIASSSSLTNIKLSCAVSETAAVGTMHIMLYANTGAANTLAIDAEM